MTYSHRRDFIESWLNEQPQRTGNINPIELLRQGIDGLLSISPKVVTNNVFSVSSGNLYYYWIEDNNEVVLGSELTLRPHAFYLSYTAKDPRYKGKPPYASQLYAAILDSSEHPIRLYSDDRLSDEGFGIWKKMVELGYSVGAYDKNNPGSSFQSIDSQEELAQFFGSTPNYRNYQYVLSETLGRATSRARFMTRRYNELCGTEDE